VGKLLRVSILCWRHGIGNLGTIEQLGNSSDQSARSGGGSKKELAAVTGSKPAAAWSPAFELPVGMLLPAIA